MMLSQLRNIIVGLFLFMFLIPWGTSRAQSGAVPSSIFISAISVVTLYSYDASDHLTGYGTGFFVDSEHIVSC